MKCYDLKDKVSVNYLHHLEFVIIKFQTHTWVTDSSARSNIYIFILK
jgi:hypothetical protein